MSTHIHGQQVCSTSSPSSWLLKHRTSGADTSQLHNLHPSSAPGSFTRQAVLLLVSCACMPGTHCPVAPSRPTFFAACHQRSSKSRTRSADKLLASSLHNAAVAQHTGWATLHMQQAALHVEWLHSGHYYHMLLPAQLWAAGFHMQ